MKVTILFDKTKIQTATPHVSTDGYYVVPLLMITTTRGSETYMLDIKAKDDESQLEVETRVHRAFVRSICTLKNIPYPINHNPLNLNTAAQHNIHNRLQIGYQST